MSEMTPDLDRLHDEAIDLVIRLQNDPENPVAIDMIRSWRARSQQHESIWARVAKLHGSAGKILTEQRRIERQKSLGLTRRNVMIGGVTVLGAGAAAWSLSPGLVLQARADHMTGKGEIRRVALPDGSTATLGPESAIAINFDGHGRGVRLLSGMSYFEVARDPDLPFTVQSGELSTTALGTAFDVSDDGGLLTVAVDHGLVEVTAEDVRRLAGQQLGAGQWIAFDAMSGNIERGQREAGQIASWRDNLLFVEHEKVSVLVARIGRWIPGRIVIAHPGVGQQRVSGVFDLRDPLRALNAVVHPAGARVRQISDFVTVISPI